MRTRGRLRRVAAVGAGVLVAIRLVASAAFRPGGAPVVILVLFAAGLLTFGYLIWRLVTGRDGIWHRGPTRRRLERLSRRRSAKLPTAEQPRQ